MEREGGWKEIGERRDERITGLGSIRKGSGVGKGFKLGFTKDSGKHKLQT